MSKSNEKIKFYKSLRGKIFFAFSGFAIVVIIVVAIVLSATNRKIIVEKTVDSVIIASKSVDYRCSEKLGEVNRLLNMGDSTVVRNFITRESQRATYALELITTLRTYREARFLEDNIENIYFIGTNGVCFSERYGVFSYDNQPLAKELMDIFYADDMSSGANKYRVVMTNEISQDYHSATVVKTDNNIYIGRPIYYSSQKYGIAVVELEPSFLTNLIYEFSEDGTEASYMLLDGSYKPVGEYEQTGLNRIINDNISMIDPTKDNGHFDVSSDGLEYTVFYNRLSAIDDWNLILAVRSSYLTKDYRAGLGVLLICIGVAAVVSLLVYFYLSTHLIRPLNELNEKFENIANANLDEYLPIWGEDEIANLERCYAKCVEDLRVLRARIAQEQQNIKRAEIALMQEQINPHFIYNTLELVMWTAAETNDYEVISIIEELSRFFRIGLSSGAERITIADELEHVESYLAIQKRRYGAILRYVIDVDSDIMGYYIPKITLQPIVENAISHGIRDLPSGGTITIKGHLEDDDTIVLTTSDDGQGMTVPQLRETRRIAEVGSNDPKHTHGFGLYNVNRRLKFYCGEEYGLSIDSERGKGTTVYVRIKATKDTRI